MPPARPLVRLVVTVRWGGEGSGERGVGRERERCAENKVEEKEREKKVVEEKDED